MTYKILHLVTTLNPGGIERWLLGALPKVNRKQYQMDFYCKKSAKGRLAPQVEVLGAKVWVNPLNSTLIGYTLRLRQVIREEQYSLVHNHLAVHSGFPAYLTGLAGVPSIVSFHNTSFESTAIGRPLLRYVRSLYARLSVQTAIRNSRAVTGCSHAVLDAIDDEYGIGEVDRRVLYYGVDIPSPASKSKRRQFRDELEVREGTQLVVHIGRFAPQKNHADLVRIAQRVLEMSPSTCFILIGDGPLRHDIERLVGRLGLTGSFRFLGIRHDVERILTCCDLFLFPSIWEGFGLVAAEANAAGIPVIGSDVPGLREAVEDGKTGILCPPGDDAAFAEAVCRLLDDAELRQRLGQNGIERVRNQFSRQRSAEELCRLYDLCLS